jgi:hypothetical protein
MTLMYRLAILTHRLARVLARRSPRIEQLLVAAGFDENRLASVEVAERSLQPDRGRVQVPASDG